MEFFRDVLINALAKEEMRVTFPNVEIKMADIVEMKCFETVKKIKAVIENDSLSDFECIEAIVCILEELGSGGGNRHDFG